MLFQFKHTLTVVVQIETILIVQILWKMLQKILQKSLTDASTKIITGSWELHYYTPEKLTTKVLAHSVLAQSSPLKTLFPNACS